MEKQKAEAVPAAVDGVLAHEAAKDIPEVSREFVAHVKVQPPLENMTNDRFPAVAETSAGTRILVKDAPHIHEAVQSGVSMNETPASTSASDTVPLTEVLQSVDSIGGIDVTSEDTQDDDSRKRNRGEIEATAGSTVEPKAKKLKTAAAAKEEIDLEAVHSDEAIPEQPVEALQIPAALLANEAQTDGDVQDTVTRDESPVAVSEGLAAMSSSEGEEGID